MMVKLSKSHNKTAPELNDRFPLKHVVWAAMEKIGGKQKKADMLDQGSKHDVRIEVTGTVDGQPFEQSIASIVSVGHEQVRSSSVNPQVPELIAYILGKLNASTRNRILTDVPDDFQENGSQLPDPCPVLLDEAKHMLQKLRQAKTVTARGSIRCEYTL